MTAKEIDGKTREIEEYLREDAEAENTRASQIATLLGIQRRRKKKNTSITVERMAKRVNGLFLYSLFFLFFVYIFMLASSKLRMEFCCSKM